MTSFVGFAFTMTEPTTSSARRRALRLDRYRGHTDPKIDGDDLLSVHEAAIVADVSDGTILNWANDGKLPHVRTPGNHRRFRLADVEAAIR